MSQGHKRGIFASMFGSKKRTEEELEAENEARQKLEQRIREVLVITETPKALLAADPEPVLQRNIAFETSGFDHPRADSAQPRVDTVLALSSRWRAKETVSVLGR